MYFKYEIAYYVDTENGAEVDFGYIHGKSYADAVKKVISRYAGPNEQYVEYIRVETVGDNVSGICPALCMPFSDIPSALCFS